MKTIEISDEAYNNIQNLKKSYDKSNLSITSITFPKIIFDDEDIIDIFTLNPQFEVIMGLLIGIELRNYKEKQNWIETKEGLKKRKKIDRKNVIDMTNWEHNLV